MPAPNMRVLIVSNFFPPHAVGGAEVVAFRQAKALATKGYEIAVFAGILPSSERIPASLSIETYEDLLVYRLVLRSLDPDANFFWSAAERRFSSVIVNFKPHIVHFHNVTGLGVNLVPLAKYLGCKVIVTLHDHWGFCFKNTLLRNNGVVCDDAELCASCLPTIKTCRQRVEIPMRLRRDYVAFCLGYADVLISPSNYMARAYQSNGIVNQPVCVISNGIDLKAFPKRSESDIATKFRRKTISFASFNYLGEHKGIDTLLRAAEILAARDELSGRWELLIAGHGHLEGTVREAISSGRFKGHVSYVGRLGRQEAIALASHNHVTVLASVWPENEPVSLLEAMAAGSAQLASRIGGNIELVEEERSGLLFQPGDANSLAESMTRLIVSPGLAESFGEFNRRRCASFDEHYALDRLLELYEASKSTSDLFDELIVICTGVSPPSSLHILVHNFHRLENRRRRIRFVWRDWADAEVWRRAGAVWVWSDEGEDLATSIILRASRAAIPILVPRSSRFTDFLTHQSNVEPYETMLEAFGILVALQGNNVAPPRTQRSPNAARILATVVHKDSFAFHVAAVE